MKAAQPARKRESASHDVGYSPKWLSCRPFKYPRGAVTNSATNAATNSVIGFPPCAFEREDECAVDVMNLPQREQREAAPGGANAHPQNAQAGRRGRLDVSIAIHSRPASAETNGPHPARVYAAPVGRRNEHQHHEGEQQSASVAPKSWSFEPAPTRPSKNAPGTSTVRPFRFCVTGSHRNSMRWRNAITPFTRQPRESTQPTRTG